MDQQRGQLRNSILLLARVSHYCNIYRAGPGVVTLGIYNSLGHIDGHINVWLRTADLSWVWAKTGNYANLISIHPVDKPVVKLPDEQDTAVIWPAIVKNVKATCDRQGQFILPECQAKADAEQMEFDQSPPDSWRRRFAAEGRGIRFGLSWGAEHAMAGCPIIERDYLPPDSPMHELTKQALLLLASVPESAVQPTA